MGVTTEYRAFLKLPHTRILDTCGDVQVSKSLPGYVDIDHFGSKSKILHHTMHIHRPHLQDMDTGHFGYKSKELHHTMHIHGPYLDMDTGHFGYKSKNLCHPMMT